MTNDAATSITDDALRKIESDAENKTVEKKPKLTKSRKKKTYENPVRARRIRIYPNVDQKTTLKRWFGGVRFCYNSLVASQRNVGQGGIDLASLRKIVKDAHETHEWLREIPCEIKDVAVRDMDKARKVHFAKLNKMKERNAGSKREARFKFRSKKDPQQSFEVRARDMMRKRGAFASLRLSELKSTEKLPDEISNSVRFVYDRLGRYWLIVPRVVERKSENQTLSKSIVALDPGVRTFQTTYDDSGLVTEWGKGDMTHVYVLCRKADKLQSSMTQKKGRKRRGAERARLRVFDKIRNKIKEIHRKMALWLCENYKVVLIPTFETSRMIQRGQRKLNSKTVRSMLTWSHYGFRETLKAKAELHPWVHVIECNEAYTSKTCGKCGEINSKLGSSKTFACAECDYVADRDINGARNVMIRYLS